MTMVRGRRLRATSTAIALAMALVGCSSADDWSGPAVAPVPPASRTPQAGSEGLAKYYSQTLAWRRCTGGQCAGLSVPLDYGEPAGQAITIQVFRMRATEPSHRLGSLVLNPGGPGGSGIDYARAAETVVDPPLRRDFDIVGFDPRGVMRSEPVVCVSDPQFDAFLGQDPTPDDATEERALADSGKDFALGCQQQMGSLLAHISTVDSAKDMDILRGALGDAKLNYLGKSYGTLLGATYAGLFPTLVGRFVLDGVLPPDLTQAQVALGQAEGFERATRAWAAACVDGGSCPLGDSVDAVMAGLRALLTSLDAHPIPMSDGRLSQLTEGWASTGIAEAMYDQRLWPTLTSALRQVVGQHNGTALMRLADQYAERSSTGRYQSNLLQAFYAITCLDQPTSPDLSVYEQAARQAEQAAPTWGAYLAWGSVICGQWPIRSAQAPHPISAVGSGPIVVIGTTRDPATPYEWSVRLHDQLANARLITFQGDGHTAYARTSDCVDRAVNIYFTQGVVPRDGLTC